MIICPWNEGLCDKSYQDHLITRYYLYYWLRQKPVIEGLCDESHLDNLIIRYHLKYWLRQKVVTQKGVVLRVLPLLLLSEEEMLQCQMIICSWNEGLCDESHQDNLKQTTTLNIDEDRNQLLKMAFY